MKNTLFRFETTNFKQTLQIDDNFVIFKTVRDVIRHSSIWQTVTTSAVLYHQMFSTKYRYVPNATGIINSLNYIVWRAQQL